MRTEKQCKQEIERLDGIIKNAKEARDISLMPGGDRFVAFLMKSKMTYQKAQCRLDPYSDRLPIDYAKHQFVVEEVQRIINLLTNAQEVINTCEEGKLKINNELEVLKVENEKREHNKM
jgi:hypothetical protein